MSSKPTLAARVIAGFNEAIAHSARGPIDVEPLTS
jgi:hypothetical protein